MIHGWYGNIFSLEVGSEYPTIYKGVSFTYETKNRYTFNQDTRLPKFNMEPTMMVSKCGISYSRVLFTGSMLSIGSKVCWGVQSFLSNIFLRGLKKKTTQVKHILQLNN